MCEYNPPRFNLSREFNSVFFNNERIVYPSNNAELTSILNTLVSYVGTSQASIANINANINDLANIYTVMNNRITNLDNDIGFMRFSLSELRIGLDNLRDEDLSIRSEISQLRTTYEAFRNGAITSINNLTSIIGVLQSADTLMSNNFVTLQGSVQGILDDYVKNGDLLGAMSFVANTYLTKNEALLYLTIDDASLFYLTKTDALLYLTIADSQKTYYAIQKNIKLLDCPIKLKMDRLSVLNSGSNGFMTIGSGGYNTLNTNSHEKLGFMTACLNFADDEDSYVRVFCYENPSVLYLESDFSIVGWVYTISSQKKFDNYIFDLGGHVDFGLTLLIGFNDRIIIRCMKTEKVMTSNYFDDRWVFYNVQRKGDLISLYLNGIFFMSFTELGVIGLNALPRLFLGCGANPSTIINTSLPGRMYGFSIFRNGYVEGSYIPPSLL